MASKKIFKRSKSKEMTDDYQELDYKPKSYDVRLEKEARAFIEDIIGETIVTEKTSAMPCGQDRFRMELQSGVALCKLANRIQPGVVPKINESKSVFRRLENIQNFLNACRDSLGVPKEDGFFLVDLYHKHNMAQVVHTILFLRGMVADRSTPSSPSSLSPPTQF